MTAQMEKCDTAPHVLIISETLKIQTRLRGIFRERKISHELTDTRGKALARLEGGEEPAPTGVITEGLDGLWKRIVPAAQQLGATTILLTGSVFAKETALSQGTPAYLVKDFEFTFFDIRDNIKSF